MKTNSTFDTEIFAWRTTDLLESHTI